VGGGGTERGRTRERNREQVREGVRAPLYLSLSITYTYTHSVSHIQRDVVDKAGALEMGNSSSVVPNESDGGRKEKQLKVQRRKESHKEAVPSPKAQRPRRSDAGKVPPKGTDVVAKASPLVKAPDVAPTPPKSDTGGTVPTAAADPKDHPPTAGLGPAGEFGQPEMDVGPDRRNDRHDSRSVQREKPQEKEVEQDLTSALDDCQPKENKDLECDEDGAKRSSSRERTASSEANSSGSNSSGSYTSSTYSSGSEDSDDDDASDDTFFVPEVQH